jgi:8-oxo-dGTP pyrophosphatase MutT (NUDIX family)
MAGFPRKGARPPFRELPILARLAVRVLVAHLGGPTTAGTMCIVIGPGATVAFVKASYRSLWSMPGGYCNRHEDPAVAAEREVLEETGIVLSTPPRLVATRNLGYRIDYFYVALADPAAEGTATSWEISDFVWADWAQRPTLDSACAFVDDAVEGGVAEVIRSEVSRLR